MNQPPLIVVCLGNPGMKYAETRHNAGFCVADALAKELGASFKMEARFLAEVAMLRLEGERFIIAKPQTFMNLSGASVKKLMNFYRGTTDRLLIVCDDADLPFGELRLREGGSCGGQNGLRSVEENLQTVSYPRLRFGIGKSSQIPLDAYVLMRFDDVEWAGVPKVCGRAIEIIKTWALEGVAKAQKKAALLREKERPKKIEG